MSANVNTGCSRGVGLLALLVTGAAMAQQQPVSDGEQPLAEIVVTSLKISQTAQSVPAAVTAVNGDELDKLGVTDLQSLAALVPSLQINTIRTQASITFRGVGQTLNSPNADPQNAVNLNGLYVPMEMSGVSFYDVERAEVVPGPQGTLYGHNATGGVVNVITKRPGTEYGGEGFVEYGNYQTVHAFAALDVPVNDQFAVRGALNVLSHNGYYNNGEDDADSKAGRLTGVWKPSADTSRQPCRHECFLSAVERSLRIQRIEKRVRAFAVARVRQSIELSDAALTKAACASSCSWMVPRTASASATSLKAVCTASS